jgi:cytochrome c5
MRRGVLPFLWTALTWGLWAAGLSLAAACGDGEDHDHDQAHDGGHGHDEPHDHAEPVGPPSGAVCPPGGGTLTYASFGKQFFSDYCLSCHSSNVTGLARMGAPADHDFDSYAEVELLIDHIDQKAAKGPSSTNVDMPPSGKRPTEDERAKLGEWIACGAPE